MQRTDYAMCMLCEAHCGIEVEHDGSQLLRIRGDDRDVASRGHFCPKGAALGDIQHDPDRLRQPLRRRADGGWEEVGWDEALELVADRFARLQREHGRDAVATYVGNPTAHNYAAALLSLLFGQVLGSRNHFTANSLDGLPRLLTSYLAYGSQAVIPIVDIDRTAHMIIIGANPVVSNGSIMTAPGFPRRLKALRKRGGRLVVIDPRRTETSRLADEHHAIRPGSDALLMAALLHTLFEERLTAPGRLAGFTDGIGELRAAVAPFAPERVAPTTGIDAEVIRRLAREFAAADCASCYGRMGTCTQPFGTLTTGLIDALHVLTATSTAGVAA